MDNTDLIKVFSVKVCEIRVIRVQREVKKHFPRLIRPSNRIITKVYQNTHVASP